MPFESEEDGLLLDISSTSVVIPADVLEPGEDYTGYIEFAHVVGGMPFDNEELPGVLTLSGYIVETTFSFRTGVEATGEQELGAVALGKSAFYEQSSGENPELLGYEGFAVALPFEDDLLFGATLEVGVGSGVIF